MKSLRLVGILAFLVLGLLVLRQRAPSPEEAEDHGIEAPAKPAEHVELLPAAQPSVTPLGEGRFRIGSVVFDKTARTITIPAEVHMRADAVEYVLVTAEGKAHESIFLTDAEPRDVHVAALLLGIKPSAELGPLEAAMRVPTSAALEAWIEWDTNGPPGKLPLHEAVGLADPDKPGEVKALSASLWLYNGSRVLEGGGFVASRDGSLISIIRDPDALINNPGATRDNDDIHVPNALRLPKLKHPVRVVLRLRG